MDKDLNKKESFDVAYKKNREVYRELEKIELAYAKIKEKYSNQKECLAFLDYAKTLEKVFTEARIRNQSVEKSKSDLIEVEIGILARESNIEAEIFKDLYNDFKKAYLNVGRIIDIQNNLLERHKDCPKCLEFINYLTNLYISFDNIRRGDMSMGDLKRGLISARMNVISYNGNPGLLVLENIYKEFKKMLNQ